MGGKGGLNILFQKEWNVYNRDNQAKVEAAEAKEINRAANEKDEKIKSSLRLIYLSLQKDKDLTNVLEESKQEEPKREEIVSDKLQAMPNNNQSTNFRQFVDGLPNRLANIQRNREIDSDNKRVNQPIQKVTNKNYHKSAFKSVINKRTPKSFKK